MNILYDLFFIFLLLRVAGGPPGGVGLLGFSPNSPHYNPALYTMLKPRLQCRYMTSNIHDQQIEVIFGLNVAGHVCHVCDLR